MLSIENLGVVFENQKDRAFCVSGVDLLICRGEIVGLVGESGCGKSMIAHAIMGLLPGDARVVEGQILYNAHPKSGLSLYDTARDFTGQFIPQHPQVRLQGRSQTAVDLREPENYLKDGIFDGREKQMDLLRIPKKEIQRILGNEIAMIFQEPMSSLNPVMTIGEQICESLTLHRFLKWEEAKKEAIWMLKKAGISDSERNFFAYPHQLSGGMRQRVMIAMALCCHPALLIADEPTTALDLTIQAQILDLLESFQKEMQMSVLLITHDFGVIARLCQKVFVMYASKIVEKGDTRTLLSAPLHPYTKGLLASVPDLHKKPGKLYSIPGYVPSLHTFFTGCRFVSRCPMASQICKEKEPKMMEIEHGHFVACHETGKNDGKSFGSQES